MQKSLSFEFQVIWLTNMAIRPPGPIFLKKLAQTVSKPPKVVHECAEKLKFRISSHLVNKQVFAVAVTQARNFFVTGTITFRHI